MVVVIDERLDLQGEVAGQIVVLEQDPVLERLVPALDVSLCLRMARGAADRLDLPFVEPASRRGRWR